MPDPLKRVLVQQLKIPNPKYLDAAKNGYSTYGIPEFITNFSVLPDGSFQVPRGYLQKLLGTATGMGVKYDIVDKRSRFDMLDLDSSHIQLRPYQARALKDLVMNGQEGLLVSPAGSGKTVMGLSLIPMFGQPTLWLTHTTPLFEQALARAETFLPYLKGDDIGTIGAGNDWKVGNVLTVGMVQTLVRRPEETYTLMNKFGMVILDEAHHAPATTFTQVLGTLNPFFLYGLTATHIRRDGLHNLMFQVLGEVLSTVTIDEVRKHEGIHVPKVICRYIDEVPIQAVSFGQILSELVDHPGRNILITNDIVSEAERGNICVVITDRRRHAEILYEFIKARWNNTTIATGNYNKKQQKEAISKLEAGEATVLVTTASLLGEGFDHAPINRGFLCLPFRNAAKTEQILGRIQRTAEGKEDAIVYDYVDNHSLLQHQFRNRGSLGCRYDVYQKLGCVVEEVR